MAQLWPGVVFRQQPDFVLSYVTPAIEALTGVPPESWGRPPACFWEVVHEEDAERVAEEIRLCAERRAPATLTYRLRHVRSGRVHCVLEHRRALLGPEGHVLGYEGLWWDQTRQVAAEERLRQAGWKEALAALTMGMGHDFNNILAGICSLSETYLSQTDAEHPFHDGLTLIHKKASQASELVHQLMSVHRSQPGARSYHDLNEIVRDALDLMRKVLPRHLEFALEVAAEPLPVYVDAVECRQVILQLTLSAVEALRERGAIRLETRRCDVGPVGGCSAGASPRPPMCRWSITHRGPGSPASYGSALADPFFTTKSLPRRLAPALSDARQFAEKHQGLVSMESAEDSGTTLHVWLPQADFTEADAVEQLRRRRRRSILLIGPPGADRDRMATLLRSHPFQVFVLADGGEDWLQASDSAVDAVVVQGQANPLQAPALLRWIRQHKLPVHVVLQILESPPDAMETQFVFQADAVLTPELADAEVLARLDALLAEPADGSGR